MLPVDVEPLWVPSPERAAATRMAAFGRRVGADDYPGLHEWSVNEPEEFWSLLWHEGAMTGERGDRVIERHAEFAATRFFPDARLSVVENMLSLERDVDPHGDAVVAVDETGRRVARSWHELRADVAAMAAALRAHGVTAGDRVAAWLPNGLEAIIAMLGAASVGAIYSSTSPDFGVEGVVDRFGQIEPVILFAASSYPYGGKRFDCRERLAEIVPRLPTVRTAVLVGDDAPGTVAWDAFLAPHRDAPLFYERFPFDHPWYILYSSGTTGVPKCIVHRTGGVLLQHMKEHQLHCDMRVGDRVMYYTTTGWMMWNWLASTLASGATAVFFDGSPFHPGPHALFDLVDSERLTLLGVSARFIESLRKSECVPRDSHRLETLRTICSTGSPLSPDGFRFVYDVRQDRRPPCLDRGRYRSVRVLARRRSHLAGPRGRDPASRARHGDRRRRRRWTIAARQSGRRRRAGVPATISVDATGLLARRLGRALSQRLLRAFRRHMGARRPRVLHSFRGR